MNLRIGIVGGSMGGLFAASVLRAAGHDVHVFERSERGLEGRGAGLVGQRELYAILRMLGCEQAARVGVLAHERITFARNGSIAQRDVTPQTQISWDHLYRTVRHLLPPAAYRVGARVVRVENGASAASVILDDGQTHRFDLVIGADGIGSVARAAVSHGPTASTYAGYVAWRGLIAEDTLPAEAAKVLSERFAFYHMHGSQILGYLVPGPGGETAPGQRRYNWVWYRQAAEGVALDRWLTGSDGRLREYSVARGDIPDTLRDELWTAARELLPTPFALAVEAEPTPSIQAIFDYESTRMVRDRVALLGDAAFVVRPHTAMGVAKAAGDAMTLVAALDRLPLEKALVVYEAERLAEGHRLAVYGRELGRPLTA
ncbi:MAG TPA: FAD-dependent monooxygenase [Luteibacter sp.]|uniref:FAD binding domain-containing protein n=1 Tax=Luteibacter sp. TaxID=1886636 RepID=UPI002B573A55|nr:FAD-dependent monooxygenase [Luteibacter sp.]HVI53753.1 FAD-dependent monooxygenase [Luteibacter sp.]